MIESFYAKAAKDDTALAVSKKGFVFAKPFPDRVKITHSKKGI